MRFASLVIEKYGIYSGRALSFDHMPGLIVAYGPNEAGKSTCLSAISDFLFGIPHNSPHGHIFGYDQMRIEATIVLSNRERLTLRRRKGRGTSKTLTDADGRTVEETVLSAILGPTTRDRFVSLFGLSHKTLRAGGERLLQADGDIGRLIVEAGGGLRTLVRTIEELGVEADRLFGSRKSADRAFYRVRGEFEEADRAVKANLQTREAYEQARKNLAEAERMYAKLKVEQRELVERLSREQRVERVAPSLLALNRVAESLLLFADLPVLPEGFASAVRNAISAREKARTDLEEAEKARDGLARNVETLQVPEALLAAEAAIRDITLRSAQVENERKSRPNRVAELDRQEADLAALRESVGLTPEADLAPLLPSRATRENVRRLANLGVEARLRMTGLQEQIESDESRLKLLLEDRANQIRDGFHQPLGISSGNFTALPQLAEELGARSRAINHLNEEIQVRLRSMGFQSWKQLQSLRCPDADTIQSELERRMALEAELLKHIEILSQQTSRRDSALLEIARLKEGEEVPTAAAIAESRRERQTAWAPIRAAYLAEDPVAITSVPVIQRGETVATYETRIHGADDLADRKSIEAQRITDLAAAEKQHADAVAAIRAAEVAHERLKAIAESAQHDFLDAWPEAIARQEHLARLKAFVIEREKIIMRGEDIDRLSGEVDLLRADHDPRIESLSLAEHRLNITVTPAAPLTARIHEVSLGIRLHEEGHAVFQANAGAIKQIEEQLLRSRHQLTLLEANRAAWLPEWETAVLGIGLKEDSDPARAIKAIEEWSRASGILEGVRITKKRLAQFDEDERALIDRIGAIVSSLDFALPEDPVAAAKMIEERLAAARKTETQKKSLAPELEKRTSERDAKIRALGAAEGELARLCAQAGTDESSIMAVADRQERFAADSAKEQHLLHTLLSAGDGRSIEALRQEWGGRDLDGVRADIAQIGAENSRVESEMEAAFATIQGRRRELDPFTPEAGVNAGVFARERAASVLHQVIERYMELTLARAMLETAVGRLRGDLQDPLLARAGELFVLTTHNAFSGICADVDEMGNPVILGTRASGEQVPIDQMSDGTRDQLFLAFRLASIEQYCAATEPLPFIADDLLVHFDDDRSVATLELLAAVGKRTQVLLFTHDQSVREAASALIDRGDAGIIDLM